MNEGINPFFFCYSSASAVLQSMLQYAKPGAIIVTGRGNRYHDAFQQARKLGAKVYTYWNVANVPENLSNPEDAKQYLIDGKPPPRWPYKTASGADRSQWPGTYLLDLRPGSPWLKHCIPNSGDVVSAKKFDGFFLDTLGARTWSSTKVVGGVTVPGADWATWSVDEQSAWAAYSVNILRELKEEIDRRNPLFELVCNNIWTGLPKGHPATDVAAKGDTHQNGCCLENPSGDVPSEFHKAYAGRPMGRSPRRVLVVDRTDADTLLWASVPGVTHVSSVEKAQGENYMAPTPPVVPYSGWPPSELEQQNAVLRARVDELVSQNTSLSSQLSGTQEQLRIVSADLVAANQRIANIHELSQPE